MTRGEALRIFELDDRRTQEEVRAAYRELVKVWHPDRFANDPDLRAKADRRLQDINRAYAVLQDGDGTVEPPREPTPPPRAATPAHTPTPRPADRSTRRRWSLALLVTVGLFTGAAVVGIVLTVVRPTQAPAPRPISGTDLLAAPLAGNGSLVVMNADGRDAVLVFVDSGVPTRALYIRAGERLQMLDVAPGASGIWVAAGRGWIRDHFATDRMFQEIAEPLTFVNDAAAPQTITIGASDTGTGTQLRARSPFLLNVRR